MSTLELRTEFLEAKAAFFRGEIDEEALYKSADAYIESIRSFKKRTKNSKLRVPTRAYLLRAIS